MSTEDLAMQRMSWALTALTAKPTEADAAIQRNIDAAMRAVARHDRVSPSDTGRCASATPTTQTGRKK